MVAQPRENAALVRRFLTDIVAGGDTEAADGFIAPGVTDRDPVFGSPGGQETASALGWRVLAAANVDIVIEETVAAADRVAVRATVTGTHRDSLMDLAPTGRPFEIAYAWFCRVENDRITAIHSLPDGLGLMRQLDAIPNPTANRPRIELTEER